jgi:predicted metal-dependent phosphoesterase TrpH
VSKTTWGKADLHIHSDHSDGLASIPQIMDYVQDETDLDVIAITDHNTIEGALFAHSLQDMYDFEVVVGEEISSKHGHIIGLFLEKPIPPGMSAVKTLAAIHEQGGVAIIPHPFSNQGIFGPFGLRGLTELVNEVAFHALEVYNSLPYLAAANRLASRAFTFGQGVASTGGSDAHVLKAVGKGYTMFKGESAGDLQASICRLETRAEADKGGLSLALRYMFRYPQIRRLQSWNWERCKV